MCLFSSLPRPDAKVKAKSELRTSTEVPHFHLHITGYYFSIPNLAAFTYISHGCHGKNTSTTYYYYSTKLTNNHIWHGCHGNMFDKPNSLIQQLSD